MKNENIDNAFFKREDISNIFNNGCNKFLHSYGQNFKGKKKYDKYSLSEAGILKECRGYQLFDDSTFIIDSGGFQISVGLLNEKESKTLLKIYYEFLKDYSDVYDRAFILDVPPGPGCKVFETFGDVYRMNFESYNTARNLPDKVREKVIYIHHFRTPKLWDIYTDLLNHEEMFNAFKYHATGGIVANSGSDASIPCIIYVLPLISLLNQAIKFKRKELHYHILGGATFRDVLFYELFKKLVKEEHDIDLHITYDSSGIFKGLMIGRTIPILDGEIIKKLDLRTDCLDKRFNKEGVNVEVFKNRLNQFAKENNIKELDKKEIYNPETGTFYNEFRIYAMLYMISLYSKVEEMFRQKADILYPLYKSGEMETFNRETNSITRNINAGKLSRKQKSKANSISRSLDMLKNLDEDYSHHIVNKFLSKDEFINLTNDKLVMF
jgi:hypothetical protein